MTKRGRCDLGQPFPGGRREVAGTRCVTPVSHHAASRGSPAARSAAAEPPGQPVMRQHHRGHAPGVGRLVLGQPAQLGHRERRRRDASCRLRPPRPAAEFADQFGGRGGRPQVVPEHGRPDHLALVVQHDHSVLLACHADRRGPLQQRTARLQQRRPPRGRVALGTGRVRCAAAADHGAVGRVTQQHLGRLRGRVHARNEHAVPFRGS